MLETQASQQSAKKGTGYTNFSDTDKAEAGWYAAEYWKKFHCLTALQNFFNTKKYNMNICYTNIFRFTVVYQESEARPSFDPNKYWSSKHKEKEKREY